MHRHGYKGRKFGRDTDQRRALLKGLASSLIDNGKIKTTLPKAKELIPYVEKLITKAKVGDLHSRRQIISKLSTITSANKLVDDIAPKLNTRNSGHLRVVKTDSRRGDNADMAFIEFVDDIKVAPVSKSVDKSAPKKQSHEIDSKGKAIKSEAISSSSKSPAGSLKTTKNVAKRTGVRGNK